MGFGIRDWGLVIGFWDWVWRLGLRIGIRYWEFGIGDLGIRIGDSDWGFRLEIGICDLELRLRLGIKIGDLVYDLVLRLGIGIGD